ncbi:hypothetical protein [Rhizobium sp.]|uniref:hypothetical protein n=1 Tax=Rhizobium sp. TaxID=391 RepID=UPI003F7D21AD
MVTLKFLQKYLEEPGSDKPPLVQALADLGIVQCAEDHEYTSEQKQALREQFDLPSSDETISEGDIISGGSF